MPAKAEDTGIYDVKAVSVDVGGTSALDARKKAFAEARRVAYGQMADKLLSAEQRPNLVMPDDRVLASLVRDFEIVSEKMTTKRYAGTFDVRFNPAAVKRTIEVSAGQPTAAAQPAQSETAAAQTASPAVTSPISDADAENYIYSPASRGLVPTSVSRPAQQAQPETILVLPWYGPVGRQTIWGEGNVWRDAWESSAAAQDKTASVILPVGDVDDLRDYSPPQPLSRRGNVASLMKRYGATQAVLAMAEKTSSGSLLISLYQYQSGAPVPMGRFGVDDASSPAAMAEAVKKSIASLKGFPAGDEAARPTQVSIAAPVVPNQIREYRTLARFSGLQQWVAMRQALGRVPGVSGLNVRAISPSQASIDFTYGGDTTALMGMLAQSNLVLEPAPQGVSTGDRPAQFTLGYKRGM